MHKIRKFCHFDAIQSLLQSWQKSEPCSPTFRAQNVSKFTRKYEILTFNIFTHAKSVVNIKMKNSPPPFAGHEFRGF